MWWLGGGDAVRLLGNADKTVSTFEEFQRFVELFGSEMGVR